MKNQERVRTKKSEQKTDTEKLRYFVLYETNFADVTSHIVLREIKKDQAGTFRKFEYIKQFIRIMRDEISFQNKQRMFESINLKKVKWAIFHHQVIQYFYEIGHLKDRPNNSLDANEQVGLTYNYLKTIYSIKGTTTKTVLKKVIRQAVKDTIVGTNYRKIQWDKVLNVIKEYELYVGVTEKFRKTEKIINKAKDV